MSLKDKRKEILKGLQKVDWRRSNKDWDNKAIVNGNISKSLNNIKLTAEYVKDKLGGLN